MSKKLKHILRKLVLPSLYRKYVKRREDIKDDIRQTLIVRGSKVIEKPIEQQFYHLMHYYPEFAFIFFWRIKTQKYLWRKLFTKPFQCKIFGGTKIEGGLMCYHPFATVINAKSIGHNFQFRNSLTIGNKGNDNTLLPVIGNDVTVGANVVIIGDIHIGDNVTIGAGAVVVKNIPSNCIVAGNPAKIIRRL
ncbi:MAG: serine acetyltransferase [Psychroserpens sp.]|uniref:serine acetyltransferase n=1 Tax=Psychroserpens sp. TaxID=2020870 RepID=UPI003CAA078C